MILHILKHFGNIVSMEISFKYLNSISELRINIINQFPGNFGEIIDPENVSILRNH